MKIVALDTATDGVSLASFSTLGEFLEFPRSYGAEVVERSRDADALLVNKAVLRREDISALPNLKYVGVTATGYNNVDVAACRERGIAVANVVGYSTDSVAQLVLAFILQHFVRVSEYDTLVKQGAWVKSPDFSLPVIPQREVASLTLGIVGKGAIGSRVAELAGAFGMTVLFGETPGRNQGAGRVAIRELFGRSDIVSLHCMLSKDTERFVNAEKLAWLKPDALLVNVSRGGLVDEAAVAAALKSGALGGYHADVLTTEPPSASNPLLAAPRVTLTPHIAWATPEARARLIHESFLNLKAFIAGERRNRVD